MGNCIKTQRCLIYTPYTSNKCFKKENDMNMIKYGFCKKSFRKNETLTSWTLWLTYFPDQCWFGKQLFNWSEFHFFKVTFLQNPYFNLHTLKKCWRQTGIVRAEFVVSFFSRSQVVIKKVFIQNEYWENNDFFLVKTSSFSIR